MIVNSAVRLAYAPHPKIMVSLPRLWFGWCYDMIKDFLDQSLPHTIRLLTKRKAQRDCLTEGREGLLSQDLIILQKGIYHKDLRNSNFFFYFWCQADRAPQQWCEDVGMQYILWQVLFFFPGCTVFFEVRTCIYCITYELHFFLSVAGSMYRYILDIQIYTVQSGHSRKSVVFSNLYSKILVVLQNYHSRVTVG